MELQQLSGDEAVRTLVRRAEGDWCGEGGTVCDLADKVLGQYPLAVSISTACQWLSMCDTCGKKTHSAQCKGTVYSYQYVQPLSASEEEEALPPAPTASAETLREAEAPAASGGSDAARLVAELAAVDGVDCICGSTFQRRPSAGRALRAGSARPTIRTLPSPPIATRARADVASKSSRSSPARWRPKSQREIWIR